MKSKIPKVLNDAPADSDSLDSHERIAGAVLELIRGANGGKIIGLEGAWGSGKSTVIKILEEKLSVPEYKDDIHLYKFDAWTHQGEPLRRAFLENLFDKTLETTWFSSGHVGSDIKNKWGNFRSELSRKIKTSTKTVTPDLDLFGVLLILSFIFFPIGSAILSSIIASGKFSYIAWTIGATIFLIPIIFLSINLTCVFWGSKDRFDLRNRMQGVVAKFVQKGYNSDTTKTSETLEPSTIEFQANFSEFLDDALSSPTKRLIIVVDNLDRVTEKEMDSIWPIIRSFVDNSEFESKKWFKRLWVIIPFAPSSLKPASDMASVNTNEEKSTPLRIAGFLDKVIQVNFSVPAPILSNLRKFIEENLVEAFGANLSDETLHKIFMIFSGEFEDNSSITPRMVISTINNMVATKLQWQEINLISHAYFSILRRTNTLEQISSRLSTNLLKSEKYGGIFPETIALDLAVLTCNVGLEVAVQKLYGDELETALTHPSGAQRLISDYSKIGYSEVLVTLLSKNLSKTVNEPELLAKKIANLVELDSSIMSDAHKEHLLQDIRGAIRKLSWFPVGSADFLTIIEYLAKNDGAKFFLAEVVSVLRRTKDALESNVGPWYSPTTSTPVRIVTNWMKARGSAAIKNYFGENFSFSHLNIPGPFEEWLRVCNELSREDKMVEGFPPRIPPNDIYREFRTTNYYSKPVAGLVSGFYSLVVNGVPIPDDLIEQGFINRITRQAELPVNEALITLPFIFKWAAVNEDVRQKVLKINGEWIFYYFTAIFVERPRRNRELDMPALNPEKLGDSSRISIVANLLFLWVLLGMQEANYTQGYQATGVAVLRAIIAGTGDDAAIISEMKSLFSLHPTWSEIIRPDNLIRFSGRSDEALKFIQRFY